MNDRAASQAVGFVLVFSLITVSIGVVYTTGYSGLRETREAEQRANVERAFDVFANNLRDLYRHGDPSRATEINLVGGSIGFGEPVRVTVVATDPDNATRNETMVMQSYPVVYTDEETSVVYSAGATFRTDSDATVMLTPPEWRGDDRQAVLPFVITYPGRGMRSLGGRSTVLLVAEHESSRLAGQFETETNDSVSVAVTVASPRTDAWKRYFERSNFPNVTVSSGGDEVTAEFETRAVYVPKSGIAVSLEQ